MEKIYASKHGTKDIKSNQSDAGNLCGMTLEDQMQEMNLNGKEAHRAPLFGASNVSKQKRSMLLSPIAKFHKQLYYEHQCSESTKQSNDPKDVLILEKFNRYIPENEIGLGCMLLIPPSPSKDSEAEPKLDMFPNKGSETKSSTGIQSPVSSPDKSKSTTPHVFKFSDALKLHALNGKTGGSGFGDVPEGESSMEDTTTFEFKSVDVTERMSRNNCSTHHMVTRSRVIPNEFINEIHFPNARRVPRDPRTNGKRQGRPRIHQQQGESSSQEEQNKLCPSITSFGGNPMLFPNKKG